jgi:hypothetical protein
MQRAVVEASGNDRIATPPSQQPNPHLSVDKVMR